MGGEAKHHTDHTTHGEAEHTKPSTYREQGEAAADRCVNEICSLNVFLGFACSTDGSTTYSRELVLDYVCVSTRDMAGNHCGNVALASANLNRSEAHDELLHDGI